MSILVEVKGLIEKIRNIFLDAFNHRHSFSASERERMQISMQEYYSKWIFKILEGHIKQENVSTIYLLSTFLANPEYLHRAYGFINAGQYDKLQELFASVPDGFYEEDIVFYIVYEVFEIVCKEHTYIAVVLDKIEDEKGRYDLISFEVAQKRDVKGPIPDNTLVYRDKSKKNQYTLATNG